MRVLFKEKTMTQDNVQEVLEARREHFEGKRERQVERFETAAENAAKRSDSYYERSGQGLPDNGQPILIGHHSEKRHRRALDKSNDLDSSVELLFSTAQIVRNGDRWELTGIPQVSRPVYESFKKVLSALGGSWNGKTHLFYRDPTAAIQEMLQVGKTPEINPYSLFETPDETVTELLDYINMHWCQDPEFQWRILEPSAGKGRIARQIRDRLPHGGIDCLEIDPINREILEAQGFNVIGEDFLSAELEGDYHFVVMNPPFNGREYIKHIKKAFSLVKEGGMVGAIAPQESLRFHMRRSKDTFGNFVAERGDAEDIGSPFEFTNVKCVQIKLLKSQRLLDDQWAPMGGYPSAHCFNLMVGLTCQRTWHNYLSRKVRERGEVAGIIQSMVAKVAQNHLVYYDEMVREQLVDEYLDSLTEQEKTEDEVKAHFAKMTQLATKAKPAKQRHKHVQVPLFDQDYLDGIEQIELAV
jgi:hypothetical protein